MGWQPEEEGARAEGIEESSNAAGEYQVRERCARARAHRGCKLGWFIERLLLLRLRLRLLLRLLLRALTAFMMSCSLHGWRKAERWATGARAM